MTAATDHPDVARALRGRHFLTLTDYSADEIRYLIDLAAELKTAKREGREEQKLVGQGIALIFEKDSTRTRCSFEVAAYDQGAHVTFIGPSGSHMGHKETSRTRRACSGGCRRDRVPRFGEKGPTSSPSGPACRSTTA